MPQEFQLGVEGLGYSHRAMGFQYILEDQRHWGLKWLQDVFYWIGLAKFLVFWNVRDIFIKCVATLLRVVLLTLTALGALLKALRIQGLVDMLIYESNTFPPYPVYAPQCHFPKVALVVPTFLQDWVSPEWQNKDKVCLSHTFLWLSFTIEDERDWMRGSFFFLGAFGVCTVVLFLNYPAY